MTLRFVCAADLRLDSPSTGIRATAPGNETKALYSTTFDSYQNIVDLCISERMDALLIVGDIYDGGDRSLRAFIDGSRGLDAARIRWFVCHGNHDPSGRLGSTAVLLAQLPPIRRRIRTGSCLPRSTGARPDLRHQISESGCVCESRLASWAGGVERLCHLPI